MLDEHEDEILGGILAQLSEHFPNYAISVLSEDDGCLHYDYSNWRIGRMLISDSLDDMNGALSSFNDWTPEDEDGEEYE